MLTVVTPGHLLVLLQTVLRQIEGLLVHDGGHTYGNPLIRQVRASVLSPRPTGCKADLRCRAGAGWVRPL